APVISVSAVACLEAALRTSDDRVFPEFRSADAGRNAALPKNLGGRLVIPFAPFAKIRGAFLGKAAGDLAGEFLPLRQVHGDGIITLRERSQAKGLQDATGDAWICSAWGVPIAVRTADCVPMLLAHPDRVIAAVHAGWRGTRARILQKVLSRLR